jgi:hypothetical protein
MLQHFYLRMRMNNPLICNLNIKRRQARGFFQMLGASLFAIIALSVAPVEPRYRGCGPGSGHQAKVKLSSSLLLLAARWPGNSPG